MNNKQIDFNNKDQIIYIPAYVEQGTEILKEARNVLEDIAIGIEKGIRKIEGSGYNRGIPYIENGGEVSSTISSMGQTIKVITNELKEYSKGRNILPDDAIIIADEDTAGKYKINKNNIYCSLKEFNEMPRINPRWKTNYLQASVGSNEYYGQDGRYTRETWCDLPPANLATLMRKQGLDLDFWIREDGVYMYGDYVMVAADIPHMDGTEQDAEYRKGDIVETSLGTGMVVDLCGMAENVRKGAFRGGEYGNVDVWYDIYTAWHDGGQYQEIGYHDPTNSSGKGVKTMISAGSTPSSLYNSTSSLQTTSAPLNAALTTTPFLIQDQNSPQVTQSANTPNSTPTYQQQRSTPTPTSTYSYNTNVDYGVTPSNDYSKTPTTQEIDPTPTPQPTLLNKIQNIFSPNTQSNAVTTQNTTPITNPITVEENAQIPTPTSSNANPNTYNTPAVTTTTSMTNIAQPAPDTNPPADQFSNATLNNNVNSQENTYVVPTPTSTPNQAGTTKSMNAVPILVSLGLATAAGVSSKVYLDNKNNKQTKKEKISTINDDNLEYDE